MTQAEARRANAIAELEEAKESLAMLEAELAACQARCNDALAEAQSEREAAASLRTILQSLRGQIDGALEGHAATAGPAAEPLDRSPEDGGASADL